MRRARCFTVVSVALLSLTVLTGCEHPGMKPAPGSQPQLSGGPQPQPSSGPRASVGRFSAIEVKHFTPGDGLRLSPEFMDYFYTGLSDNLKKTGIAGQIVAEGTPVSEADAANAAILEGKFTEYTSSGLVGIVGSEIKLYRMRDHTLLTTIASRAPYKPSPFNTDKSLGQVTGARTAQEIARALK